MLLPLVAESELVTVKLSTVSMSISSLSSSKLLQIEGASKVESVPADMLPLTPLVLMK